jgi:hypothetical protein
MTARRHRNIQRISVPVRRIWLSANVFEPDLREQVSWPADCFPALTLVRSRVTGEDLAFVIGGSVLAYTYVQRYAWWVPMFGPYVAVSVAHRPSVLLIIQLLWLVSLNELHACPLECDVFPPGRILPPVSKALYLLVF